MVLLHFLHLIATAFTMWLPLIEREDFAAYLYDGTHHRQNRLRSVGKPHENEALCGVSEALSVVQSLHEERIDCVLEHD